MKLLQFSSALARPAQFRAESFGQSYRNAFWSGDPLPEPWVSSLSAAGVTVTPDLALTLSAMYAGVTMIGRDLATLPAQTFRQRDDGGKDRVKPIYGRGIDQSNGIGSMAYMLRWQPNFDQTATEFWLSMVAQFLLRGVAYAEILSGRTGFVEQLLPRHPDRIRVERLPNGNVRYRLAELSGQPRYVTQDEMFVVRDMTFDGLNTISRVNYGAQAVGSALATQRAAGRFFKTGMTASTLVTYEGGQMEAEQEATLHGSISRYAAGMDNQFGLMLVPDNIKVQQLGVEPEKAQMMLAQEWGVREVARLLNLPGAKLGIKDSVSYNSQVQAALDYVISTLRPIAVTFEQAVQRDLILAKDSYVMEFQLAALLRGDFESQANYLEKFVRNRVMRPSEARVILNMNPDAELDKLSEGDFRPGASNGSAQPREAGVVEEEPRRRRSERAFLKGTLALHDNAVRCLRRERAAVEKLARKHAEDVAGWQGALREFYGEHAAFVSQVMRMPPETARAYAAQHGTELEAKGIPVFGDEWERCEADELCLLALDGERMAA